MWNRQDLVDVDRARNAIALDSVSMSMLRVNTVEELAKKYPIVEVEIKNFQARRAAALSKHAHDHSTGDAADVTSGAIHAEREQEAKERDEETDPSNIYNFLVKRANKPGYASAGGVAQEVREKYRRGGRKCLYDGY